MDDASLRGRLSSLSIHDVCYYCIASATHAASKTIKMLSDSSHSQVGDLIVASLRRYWLSFPSHPEIENGELLALLPRDGFPAYSAPLNAMLWCCVHGFSLLDSQAVDEDALRGAESCLYNAYRCVVALHESNEGSGVGVGDDGEIELHFQLDLLSHIERDPSVTTDCPQVAVDFLRLVSKE
jgi:hypothetical protein